MCAEGSHKGEMGVGWERLMGPWLLRVTVGFLALGSLQVYFLTMLFICPLVENTFGDLDTSRNGADSSVPSGRFFKGPRMQRGPFGWGTVKGHL